MEGAFRLNAVLDEELGLELVLREVFKEDSCVDGVNEMLDQGHGCGLVVSTGESTFS